MTSDVLVIGSGPAGYTAAIYSSRAGREITLVSGAQQGGQLMITTTIENYPGFSEPISGSFLMEEMKNQAINTGAKVFCDTIVSVNFSSNVFECFGESGSIYRSHSVIIATGATAKWLGITGEREYLGRGVSACATCDGFFFRNKNVAVIGGGNTAVEDAIFLSNFAKSVTLIHRRDSLRAEYIMQQRLLSNDKISIIWDTVVEEIYGDECVTGVSLLNLKTQERNRKDIDGVFVAIGHEPSTSIFKEQITLDPNGYIITNKFDTSTSVKGVFAAGDVCDPIYRQAITSAAQGCMAAIDADRFLAL